MSGLSIEEQMRLMDQIVRQMKEIPELPSEAPKDNASLTKVEFLDEGGIFTHMSTHEYPYRGFPYFEFVDKIDIIKKISRAFLSGMYHGLKHRKLWLITLLPALWIVKVLVRIGVYSFYRIVERFRIKNTLYCQSIRELYRVLSIPVNKDTTFQLQFRDLVCMILEFDNAYRYRFQDVIEEMDKDAMRKNPAKELTRLFSVMQGREKGQDVKDTWTLFKLFIWFYLRIDGELRKIFAHFAEMDVALVKLTTEDKWYCPSRSDYTMGFITKLKDIPDKDLTAEQKLDRYLIQCAIATKEYMDQRAKIVERSTQVQNEIAQKHQLERNALNEVFNKVVR